MTRVSRYRLKTKVMPALRCSRLSELFGVATKAAKLGQNAKPVRMYLEFTHLSVDHSESTDGTKHNITTSSLYPKKFPLMCPTHRPEGNDSISLSDEIINCEMHISVGIMEPDNVLPKTFSSWFPAVAYRFVNWNMHRIRGDEFVKEMQVSCPE